MSAFSDFCKAVKSVFDFKTKKYDGEREDRLKREFAAQQEWEARHKRIQEGWREKSASKILGG